ncbi:O-antigen ligase family protein [Propionivibrio sp.]|uniref:O-antigen ligase family protein n=1 Tax=Propionivibrio sp. TaxID=2212460 RepID=UPI002623DD01|nr:O-antigen ligase family protein [Propionivibrio sp.]
MNKFNRLTLAYAATLGLVFIWSIPGTIALRTLLLVAALTLAACCTTHKDWATQRRWPLFPLLALALLTAWLFFQAVFVSAETAWALGELRGQWLTALAAFGLGVLMSKLDKPQASGYSLWTGIALVLSVQAAIAISQSVWHWFMHGRLLYGVVPLTGGRLEMSYIMNILLALLTVDLFFRATEHRALLRIPVSASLTCAALGLTANFLAGSRNGILGTLFLALTMTCLFLIDGRRKLGNSKTILIATALAVGIGLFALASYQADSRWKTFSETAEIAMDIDGNEAWFDPDNHPLPLLSNGEPVEESAYLRIAWLSAGIRLAKDIPYGVGYGRNAFVRVLLRQGYPAKIGHSHSGFIDLLSGAGIPAVALWLIFAAAMLVTGWRSFTRFRSPLGLLLILLVSGHTGRMLIESVNRDHMLQIFFFLIGALLIADASRTAAKASSTEIS